MNYERTRRMKNAFKNWKLRRENGLKIVVWHCDLSRAESI